MQMDAIKTFAKNEKYLETFIQTIIINCQYIRMEFRIKKWTMLIMKEKRKATEGTK